MEKQNKEEDIKELKEVKGSKLSIGQKVYIIENDLSIAEKEVLSVIVEKNDFKYKLDSDSCGGSERKEIFIKKSEAEVAIKNFMDNLKFRVGDLVIFKVRDYNNFAPYIGRIDKIEFSKSPYSIKTSYNTFYDVTDENTILKVKNDFIENFGDLSTLHEKWKEKSKELNEVREKIEKEYERLEKELKYSFKKYFGWTFLSKKPKFEDRFIHEEDV